MTPLLVHYSVFRRTIVWHAKNVVGRQKGTSATYAGRNRRSTTRRIAAGASTACRNAQRASKPRRSARANFYCLRFGRIKIQTTAGEFPRLDRRRGVSIGTSAVTAGFTDETDYYYDYYYQLLTLMEEEFCDCGPHSTCKPGDETCTGCGKKCRPNASKIEEVEE